MEIQYTVKVIFNRACCKSGGIFMRIIFLFWKGIRPTKSQFWSRKTDVLRVCNEKCAWKVTDSQVDCRIFTATMLFRCYDNSFALKVESIQLQNYSLWYLLPTKIKTEDTGQFKSTLSDSRLLFSDLRRSFTGDRYLWGLWFALDWKRYKNTRCFSTGRLLSTQHVCGQQCFNSQVLSNKLS